jgi:hypothetical protein
VLVVARRWDQLGARLNAMLNARSIADAFGLEFRFIWPRGADAHINDPTQLFTSAYLDRFEIEAATIAGRTAVPSHELLAAQAASGPEALGSAEATRFVDVNDMFDIVRIGSETRAAAWSRFMRGFEEIDWQPEIRRVLAFCSEWAVGGGASAVHVRAGDIVAGDWRHLVMHEKYTPTPFVNRAIEQLAEGAGKRVLVLSDNAPYLAWLRERYRSVVTADRITPGYQELTEIQQALADVLLMSRCDLIVGPPLSAFDRLAANLGDTEVIRADRLVAAGDAREVVRVGIEDRIRDAATTPGWPGLLARDICWYLDVFGDTQPVQSQLELITQAVELDPDFSAALARLARIAAVSGDWRLARHAAGQAVGIAETVDRHGDPLVEALATETATECFAVVRGAMAPGAVTDAEHLRWSWRFERIAQRRRARISAAAASMTRSVGRCEALETHQIDKVSILGTLWHLIATVEWLSDQSGPLLQRASRQLAGDDEHPVALSDGTAEIELHRAAYVFDPVSRDLDRMASRLYDVIRLAVGDDSEP